MKSFTLAGLCVQDFVEEVREAFYNLKRTEPAIVKFIYEQIAFLVFIHTML
jgi:hypothetical protein